MPEKIRMRPVDAAALMRHLLLAWLMAVTTEYLLLPQPLRVLESLQGLKEMSFVRVVAVTGGIAFFLFALSRLWDLKLYERWAMAGVFALLSGAAVTASFGWAFLAACLLVLVILVVYALRGWDRTNGKAVCLTKDPKVFLWLAGALAAAFFLFVSVWTVCRVLSFSTPTFDFGIFAQMFHHMQKSGLPMTTVERDGLLSHFAVHVSPVYYLFLPFYYLAPTPATLQVLQAAVLASAVIPLWKLGKHHGLDGFTRVLLCALLVVFPAYAGGTSYDLHENCFLTPLILWLLYAIDKKNLPLTALFSLLTLTVKEDAAVYVAVVGLYLTVRTVLRRQADFWKQLLTGLGIVAVAVGWFFGVTGYLATSGDGVMTYRYSNFIYDGSGSLLSVVKAVLMHPLKALFECVDADKLVYIAQTMLPLLGLPLLTRKYERYLLLIPYILVNLMSDYRYQHDIFFQYNFGSIACLMYLAAVNAADLKLQRTRVAALGAATLVALGVFCGTVVPKAAVYPKYCVQFSSRYENIRQVLSQIPDEASVTAATFYTTYLSQRDTLYDLKYCSQEHLLSTEYVVIAVRSDTDLKRYARGDRTGLECLVSLLEANGYTLFAQYEGVIDVYKKTGG